MVLYAIGSGPHEGRQLNEKHTNIQTLAEFYFVPLLSLHFSHSYTHRIRCGLTIARNVSYLTWRDDLNIWTTGCDLIGPCSTKLGESPRSPEVRAVLSGICYLQAFDCPHCPRALAVWGRNRIRLPADRRLTTNRQSALTSNTPLGIWEPNNRW